MIRSRKFPEKDSWRESCFPCRTFKSWCQDSFQTLPDSSQTLPRLFPHYFHTTSKDDPESSSVIERRRQTSRLLLPVLFHFCPILLLLVFSLNVNEGGQTTKMWLECLLHYQIILLFASSREICKQIIPGICSALSTDQFFPNSISLHFIFCFNSGKVYRWQRQQESLLTIAEERERVRELEKLDPLQT